MVLHSRSPIKRRIILRKITHPSDIVQETSREKTLQKNGNQDLHSLRLYHFGSGGLYRFTTMLGQNQQKSL